jgi:hypothetical protein
MVDVWIPNNKIEKDACNSNETYQTSFHVSIQHNIILIRKKLCKGTIHILKL